MVVRKLLICKNQTSEIEKWLKRMYLKRVKEMFRKALNTQSIFNVFDEIFHGLSRVSEVSYDLYVLHESLLTITSYYQHSQAGRGSLVALLLKDLGETDEIEYEFDLTKLPKLLGQSCEFEESELTQQKFDIMNKFKNNLVLCELKMKVYSGCTAGRVEMMEKFNKFTKLIIGNETFRNCLKNGKIENIFLMGGVLYDIEGKPATAQKDEEWGICYNGLLRGKDEIIKTLKNEGVDYVYDDQRNDNQGERAFSIKYTKDGINVNIIFDYGNKVIESLFVENQKQNIKYFDDQMKKILYDDLWLGQLIAISERAVLAQNIRKNKHCNNHITLLTLFLTDKTDEKISSEVEKLRKNIRDANELTEDVLKKITDMAVTYIKNNDKELSDLGPTFAQRIMDYRYEDYVADIIQFLLCDHIVDDLKNEFEKVQNGNNF